MKNSKILYKCIIANTSVIRQHAAHTIDQLLAAKQEPYKKAHLVTKNTEGFSEKSSEKWTSRQKKIKTERVTELGRRTSEEIGKWNQMRSVKAN